jgi:hypothetical protein
MRLCGDVECSVCEVQTGLHGRAVDVRPELTGLYRQTRPLSYDALRLVQRLSIINRAATQTLRLAAASI